MDPSGDIRLSSGIFQATTPRGSSLCISDASTAEGSAEHNGGGGTEFTGQTSDPPDPCRIAISRILQRHICCPQERRGWRPVINLKSLNQYLEVPHFKMESIQSLKDVILPGDHLAKIDLKDAYLSVPMDVHYYPYLRFHWMGDIFEFTSLPFGLAPAPLIFTKLLKPVAGFLRSQGVRLITTFC